MAVDDILKTLRAQIHVAESEVKELNTVIARLEMMGTKGSTINALRIERKEREQEVVRLRRMIDASAPTVEEASGPVAFTTRPVATTRGDLPEVGKRTAELRAMGRIKGRQRLPLEDCYDLITTSDVVRQVVSDQFWHQVDRTEAHGECWPAKEEFKRNNLKKSLIKAVYIAALGCKLPAVRLACLLEGVAVEDDTQLRNTCGNSQCVKPCHNKQGRETTKGRKKDSPISGRTAVVGLDDMQEAQGYLHELLVDQQIDGESQKGLAFRTVAEQLVREEKVANTDILVKAIRHEGRVTARFYLRPEDGKLYLRGFPIKVRTHAGSAHVYA